MPVLHAYVKKDGYYVLAGVNGRIVTYRLSSEGAAKLIETGISDGGNLGWPMLLELIRQGDAFTGTPGEQDEDLSGWTQLGLLFAVHDNEPSTADPVPLCACGSMVELHIAELPESRTASLLCKECRMSRRDRIDASIPIYMINTPSALERLLARSGLSPDSSVVHFEQLLNMNLSAKWQSRVRPKRSNVVQAGLFAEPVDEQHRLL